MKYIIIFFLFCLITACDRKIGKEMPVRPIPEEKVTKVSLEVEIEMLRNEVQGINEKKVMQTLNESQKTRFNNRIKELKRNLNETISLIRPFYTEAQKRQLESSYAQTKEIWDYLVKNYKI